MSDNKSRSGVPADPGEVINWDSSQSTVTAGPLVVYESGHSGAPMSAGGAPGTAGMGGASVVKIALATALANHDGRLMFTRLGRKIDGSDSTVHQSLTYDKLATTGATFKDPVYLSDAGAPALTAGTVPRVIGYVQYVGAASAIGTSTAGRIRLCPPHELKRIWVQHQRITAVSTAVTGSGGTSAQTYDKSLSIPSRRLFNGVRARIRAVFNVGGQNSTNTHTYTLRIGGTDWITTGAVDSSTFGAASTTVGTKIIMEGEIELRAAPGASAAGIAYGRVTYDSVSKTMVGLTTASTFATNAAITVDAQVTYSANSASNTSTLQSLTIDYIDPV